MPHLYEDTNGIIHSCDSDTIVPGYPWMVVWTKCGIDVPPDTSFKSLEEVTCEVCKRKLNEKGSSEKDSKQIKIWGEKVPCSYFLGEKGLSEEKKKEIWIKVCSDDRKTQDMIERDIHYVGTFAHYIYSWLNEHPDGVITFDF